MKKQLICLLSLCALNTTLASDNNCTDSIKYPHTADICNCVINNAVTDCQKNSPIKSMCNKTVLSSYFKKEPSGAIAQCERYRDKSSPDECQWSVSFYDQNC